jgi:hypothetical protein
MKLVSRNAVLLLTFALAGCAGSLRPADLAAPEAAMVGDYHVQPSINGGRLMLACGQVRLSLAVADAEVAPEGSASFEVSRAARRQADPFACRVVGDLSCGALGREVSSPVVRRYTGKIAVLRVGAD